MKMRISLLIGVAAILVFTGVLSPASPVAAQAGTAAERPAGFEDMAEKLLPTVVNISTTMKLEAQVKGKLPPMPQFPPGSPFEEFFKDFYDQYQNGNPPAERKASSLGSGFV